jgi:hypothetical protein
MAVSFAQHANYRYLEKRAVPDWIRLSLNAEKSNKTTNHFAHRGQQVTIGPK